MKKFVIGAAFSVFIGHAQLFVGPDDQLLWDHPNPTNLTKGFLVHSGTPNSALHVFTTNQFISFSALCKKQGLHSVAVSVVPLVGNESAVSSNLWVTFTNIVVVTNLEFKAPVNLRVERR